MASNPKPAGAGAMDVHLNTNYYCSSCGCGMGTEVVDDTRIIRCMYKSCDHFNIPYEQPKYRVKLFVPKDKRPESPLKESVAKKGKI